MQRIFELCFVASLDVQRELEDMRSRDVYAERMLHKSYSSKKKINCSFHLFYLFSHVQTNLAFCTISFFLGGAFGGRCHFPTKAGEMNVVSGRVGSPPDSRRAPNGTPGKSADAEKI